MNQTLNHKLHEFCSHVNLWNVVPGGSGKGIVLLRKAVDSIHNGNYSHPGSQPPSFLICGATGKRLTARALINSLALDDYRLCPGKFFDRGYSSFQFFYDSFPETAHIITNIENLTTMAEATLWKFLHDKFCNYYTHSNKSPSNILGCNGMIIMTCKSRESVSDALIEATDYIVELEPLTDDQILAVIHQRLHFCGVEYEGEEVLKALYEQGFGQIEHIIPALERSLMLMQAEMQDFLSLELVEKAEKLFCNSISPYPPK
jgi:hypothetical protein